MRIRDDGGDECVATRLFHQAIVTLYGSCDGGESSVSLSNESVKMNGEVYWIVGAI
ncbi:hypothetical protein Tco_0439700, partial [Tanacetum coccineum]